MAEKERAPCNLDLLCPLCLDNFDDATLLTCEHTFCRKCLIKCDVSDRGIDHLTCPLCRKATKLPEARVHGLASNVSINRQVDECISSMGGMMALLHVKQKCTSCDEGSDALSFCSDCDVYMCERCHVGHKQMQFIFAKHRVALIDDWEKVVHQQCDRCSVHELEKKDLFCETCKLHVCLKCVVVNHRDHQIKNQEDFENDIRRKNNDIRLSCDQEKNHIKKNIQRIERVRQSVRDIIQDLEGVIANEYEKKIRCMMENHTTLVGSIRSLEKGFNEELDKLKASQRHRVKNMSSSLSLLMIDRLKSLEGESLSAHSQVCRDLEKLLEETNDMISADLVKQTAESVKFCSSDEKLLDLGHLEVRMKIVKELEVDFGIWGMTALSQNAVVAVPGGGGKGSYSFYLSGEKKQHLECAVGSVHDITFLTDGRLVASRSLETCSIYSNGNTCFQYTCNKGDWDPRLCSDQNDRVYAVNMNPEIYIFQGNHPNPQRVVPTGNIKPIQICVTKTGAMITSTCITTPSTVTVYDIEGRTGSTIKAMDDSEYLYAAVDSNDGVLIARVNRGSDILRLVKYTLNGLTLKEQITFRELKLPHIIEQSWCNMVVVTTKIVAFATLDKHLYFIELDV